MALFTCGPSGPIQETSAPLDRALPSGVEALRRCLSHPEYSGTASMPSRAFRPPQVVPIRHSSSCHSPSGLPEQGNPPGEPSLQPPGTTLEIVDDVDPTDCYLQQQQPLRRLSRYPQWQRSAPDYYSPSLNQVPKPGRLNFYAGGCVTVYVCTNSVLTLYCVELHSGTCASCCAVPIELSPANDQLGHSQEATQPAVTIRRALHTLFTTLSESISSNALLHLT